MIRYKVFALVCAATLAMTFAAPAPFTASNAAESSPAAFNVLAVRACETN